MANVCCVQVRWRDKGFDLPVIQYGSNNVVNSVKFHPLIINPELQYPLGRKGLALWSAWQQLGVKADADGMLIADSDVAIDPSMVATMFNAIHERPNDVHTAPVKLWPSSTGRIDWIWAHWKDEASQTIDNDARFFSFCFTYLPKRLFNACEKGGIKGWTYPNVDASVSDWARRANIPGHSVPGIEPVHMHW